MTPLQSLLPLALHVQPGRGASKDLHGQLRTAILEGRLADGFRLPPSRTLAEALGMARSTVVLVYEMLVAEGYASVRQGDGTFVRLPYRGARHDPAHRAASPRVAPSRPAPRFDLRLGSPDTSQFPFDVWRRLVARASKQAINGTPRDDPAGPEKLRDAIVGHASFARAVSCRADDIVVTCGAQQAFDLLARTLVTPGTVVAVEDPGYTPARNAFALAGARVVGVPVDEEGMIVERIPRQARVICVTPSHQFPLGVTLSHARRAALLERARTQDALVVEDDYDCEFRYDPRPLDALQILAPSSVCYVGTFSKTMFPSLRLGFAIVPASVRARLLEIRQVSDGFGPTATQLALATFIGEGHLHRHVRRMQRVYAGRREALLEGIQRRLAGRVALLPSSAGLHFSFRALVDADPAGPLMRTRMRELDIALEPCSGWALSARGEQRWSVGFGALRDDQLEEAVERMRRLFRPSPKVGMRETGQARRPL